MYGSLSRLPTSLRLVFKNSSVAVEAPWPVRWREATGKILDFDRSGRSAQTATQPAGCGG